MRIKGVMKVAMVIALIAIGVFALGGIAFASTGLNGSGTQVGDPVGADVSPHGGYSSSTDYCLQCHSVHKAPGVYALMASTSVTGVCKTCHGLFGGTPTGVINPGFPAAEGTAAQRTAYDITGVSLQSEHSLGATSPPGEAGITMTESGWAYGAFAPKGLGNSCSPNDSTNPNWAGAAFCGPKATTAAGAGTSSDISGGLYCGDCHTPHGEFGQVVNSRWYRTTAGGNTLNTPVQWQNGAPIYSGYPASVKYLHLAGAVWQRCDDAAGTLNCVNLSTTDSEGQTSYLYGYKLLSAYPNHSYGTPESWGVDRYNHDGARWCGACHPSRVSSDFGAAFTYHNHPTGCTACHGNPTADPTSKDFPHTSTFAKFLKDYPDALCISCHTSGSLP